MITLEERRKIKEYFKRFPTWTIWTILISIPFIGVYGIGIIGFIISGITIYKWQQKIDDKQFDYYRNKSLRELRKVALEKLRLDESELVRDNESIISPKYWNIGGAKLGMKKGKDDVLRYSPIGTNLIFFTENKLCIYQCALDLFTGNPLNICSSKYYYQDIVAIETQSHAFSIKEGELNEKALKYMPNLRNNVINGVIQINQSEQFVLTTKGGTAVKIQLPDYSILNYGLKGKLSHSRSDKAIASVEAMLDSKKS
ncbi:hypothetical protein [Tenacibaculum amylolyticum]|uniref:hypothetical protein n=1 Tax=Tenacibaculum amylolyticum TaxID=104269 RepID=UPI003894037D